jgi:hypothetical protein
MMLPLAGVLSPGIDEVLPVSAGERLLLLLFKSGMFPGISSPSSAAFSGPGWIRAVVGPMSWLKSSSVSEWNVGELRESSKLK